jgi:hypothetical protein
MMQSYFKKLWSAITTFINRITAATNGGTGMAEQQTHFGFSFEEGVEAGIQRASAYGLDTPVQEIGETLDRSREEIARWPSHLSGRSQAMFAETVTVASFARLQAEDSQPGPVTLRTFLSVLAGILNCLAHDE